MGKPYTCPYCHLPTTVSRGVNLHESDIRIITGEYAIKSLAWVSVVSIKCPNTECNRCSLLLSLKEGDSQVINKVGKFIKEIPILPEANILPKPQGVPNDIYQIYKEACLVNKYSPAASAALARTCLEKMLRDYWPKKIEADGDSDKHTEALKVLVKEGVFLNKLIEALYKEDRKDGNNIISKKDFEILDTCRKFGNSAAHWKERSGTIFWEENSQDYANLINEAIYSLFENWYLKDHTDKVRYGKIKELAKQLNSPDKKAKPSDNKTKGMDNKSE